MLTGIVFRYICELFAMVGRNSVWGLVWIVMLGSVGVMAQWRCTCRCVRCRPMADPVVILSKAGTMIFVCSRVYYGIEVFSPFHRVSVSLDLSCVGKNSRCRSGQRDVVGQDPADRLDVRAWLADGRRVFTTYGDPTWIFEAGRRGKFLIYL